MTCPRCAHNTDPRRFFCEHCGWRINRDPVAAHISTEASRGRALEELDRKVGLLRPGERSEDAYRASGGDL